MTIPHSFFIAFDVLVGFIFVFCMIKGYINGFVYELINLVFLIVSIIFAWIISPVLGSKVPIFNINSSNELVQFANENMAIGVMINSIGWFVILVLVLNLLFILVKPIFKAISKIPLVGSVNKVLGIILGTLRAFVICLLVSVLITLPIIKNGNEVKNNTVLKYGDNITKVTTKFIVEHINLNSLKDKADSFDVEEVRKDILDTLVQQGIIND